MRNFKFHSYHVIVAICVVVWICQLAIPSLTNDLSLNPATFKDKPWTIFTTMFAHSLSPFHLILNMLSLWYVGKAVVTRYPEWWFLSTYLVGGLAGGVVWLLWGPLEPVVGASGAIFAILGMALPLTRFNPSVLLLAAINIGLSFTIPNVAWQVHLGGFAVGILFGSAYAIYITSHNKKVLEAQAARQKLA